MQEFLKSKIDAGVLGEYAAWPQLVEELGRPFRSKKDVKEAVKFVKKSRKEFGIDDVDPLLEELAEIAEDLTWSASKRGKLVTMVSENSSVWEAEVMARFPVDGLMIRAHTEKPAVCVMGAVPAAVDKDAVLALTAEISGLEALDFLTVAES